MATVMENQISSSLKVENENRNAVERKPMPIEILNAAIEGNRDVLIQRLQLEEEKRDIRVIIDPSDPAAIQRDSAQDIESDLQSATHFGNTVLHILVIHRHNELAAMVFKKDMSLLKVQNKMLETPLHFTAKTGNEELIIKLIQLSHGEVKDALRCTNHLGETAFHVAAKHSNEGIIHKLMQLDPSITCVVDKKGVSPLHTAIVRGNNTSMVKTLLQGNPSLAYVPDSNGLFPVHTAARNGNFELVTYFMREYHDSSELLDHHGRNIFHYAAQENKKEVFTKLFGISETDTVINKMVTEMINEMDSEGNTPLHVAAMKGYMLIMIAISVKNMNVGNSVLILNNDGLSPFDLSVIQMKKSTPISEAMKKKTEQYISDKGPYFTPEWFKLLSEPTAEVQEKKKQDVMDKTQIVGLGSVLIATVTFAAAFTLPGGFNSDNGTPVLGRRYIFKAFILADTLAFLKSFISVVLLILGAAGSDPSDSFIPYAWYTFCSGASCMVVAFGLGLYLVLAPVSKAIGILVLVVALLHGSPAIVIIVKGGQAIFATSLFLACQVPNFLILMYVVPYMFIFFFAFLCCFSKSAFIFFISNIECGIYTFPVC